jgi:hypothetical protein
MLRQILVAITGAIAAQLTLATLGLKPLDRSDRDYQEAPRAHVRLATVPGSAADFLASPILASNVAPFLGASQLAGRDGVSRFGR